MCPRTTLASQRPCSGMGWCMRRLSWSLTAFSFARIRFEIVIRFSQNRPFPDFAQMCVNPRKSNVSGLPSPRGCPVPGGLPPELDQPGLIRVQLQPELRGPAAKLVPEPLSVFPVLEPDDEIVGETHDDHITARVPLPPPAGPQVQDVAQVHVGEQRRNRCPLR